MAETKAGGAYLRPDGKTWVNANGDPVEAPTRKERRGHDEAQAEAERLAQEADAQQEAQAVTETPAVRRARG